MKKKNIYKAKNFDYVARIGWQHLLGEDTYNFGYINSFISAGNDLVENNIPDLYVFPIMFCYRQYIELSLKNICYCSLNDDEYSEFIRKSSHDLEKIWLETKEHLEKFDIKDKEKISFLKDVIDDFHELDSTSFNFRYPKDKKLNFSLGDKCKINDDGKVKELIIDLKKLKYNVNAFDDIIRHTYDSY